MFAARFNMRTHEFDYIRVPEKMVSRSYESCDDDWSHIGEEDQRSLLEEMAKEED